MGILFNVGRIYRVLGIFYLYWAFFLLLGVYTEYGHFLFVMAFLFNAGRIYRVLGIFYQYCPFLFNVGRIYRVVGIFYLYGHSFLMLGVYTEYWAFSIRIGHFFLLLGVYTEHWAFSICIGHSFISGRQIQCGFVFVGSPFLFTFWANIEDSGLRFTSLCPCVLRLGRGYCRVEFQYALD
jgi:hypothetical protein